MSSLIILERWMTYLCMRKSLVTVPRRYIRFLPLMLLPQRYTEHQKSKIHHRWSMEASTCNITIVPIKWNALSPQSTIFFLGLHGSENNTSLLAKWGILQGTIKTAISEIAKILPTTYGHKWRRLTVLCQIEHLSKNISYLCASTTYATNKKEICYQQRMHDMMVG